MVRWLSKGVEEKGRGGNGWEGEGREGSTHILRYLLKNADN